jgi:ectoine hydroxylase-related dioxygenase (phytanoyl-CoA dioxygenase family)
VFFVLDQIFLKPARHGAGTSWHQDNGYWKQPQPTTSTGMWIAVHDATKANGTMNIIPRSHIRLEEHERDLNSDHHIHVPKVDESKAVTVELKAGGVLFFNFGILHCTRANTTDRERAGLALHFINQDSMSADFLATKPYGTCHVPLTDREGRLQPGIPSPETWAREVERSLAETSVQVA